MSSTCSSIATKIQKKDDTKKNLDDNIRVIFINTQTIEKVLKGVRIES